MKKHSEEHRRKLSESMKGNKNHKGHKNTKETLTKMSKAHKGKKVSKETRRKISKALKGNHNCLGHKMSDVTKGKLSKVFKGKKGYKHTREARRKMSEAKRGEKSYRWKGGISPENKKIRHSIEYRLWREAVFARDGWTCQKTGVKEGCLRCHHIQNFSAYPELRFAIDNGITLSKEAHQEFHKIYGRTNNTRDQLEEYLNQVE